LKKRNYCICLFKGSLLIILVFLIYSCDKLDIKRVTKVRTGSITNLTSNSCTVEGIIIDKGEKSIEEHGHCWSETQNPSTRDSTTHLGYRNSTGIFTSNLTGLSANTTYYIKAYFLNNTDTVYGNEASLITNPGLPSLTTSPITSITETTATSGGKITKNGGTPVTARGVCWSTSQNPTIANGKSDDGNGTGDFESNLSGLVIATNYYIRAYATNSAGTAYGNQVSFASLQTGQFTDIENNVYNSVTIGTQIWMKENLKTTKTNDNTSILNITGNNTWSTSVQAGYCWYNNEKDNYKDYYGALYNWYAINTGNLCPVGWHVPSDGEWSTLVNYLGGQDVAGGKMKEIGTSFWQSPNSGATNESGFSALGGGQRSPGFYELMLSGRWWSAIEADYSFAWATVIGYNTTYVLLNWRAGKGTGLSVRCLKNN
jgi:uncharacterized protein (TIGR02145 family)